MSGWLGVVAAAHVRRGRELGIAQLGHGRRGPLARLSPGDVLVYYSPTENLGDKAPLREFTAFGTVADGEIFTHPVEGEAADAPRMTGDMHRRRVDWLDTRPVALADVRDDLHLTQAPNWGYRLRTGLVPLDDHDVVLLRERMAG